MNEEPNFTGEPRSPRFKCFDPTKRSPRFKHGDRVVYMPNSEPKFCGTVTQVNEHQGTTESTYYYTYHILFDHGMDAKWVNEEYINLEQSTQRINPSKTTAMKEETKQLLNFYKEFGADAQKVLDFASNEINQRKMRNIFAHEETEGNILAENNEAIPDGVYFIAGGSDGEINTKTYAKYDPSMTAAPFPTKYIGVKMGTRAIAVSLEDLPSDSDGELKLLPRDHTSPEISEHYSWNYEADKRRFNAFEDFDGKGNTERLKEYGSKIEVPEGEWIPSMGELGLLMMHATDVNRAIELAGGKPIKGWHWSSTEYSQFNAWYVSFSDGFTYNAGKCNSRAVRTVAAF